MNIAVVGNILAVTSDIKASAIKKLTKANPEALKLLNEDREVIFAVGLGAKGAIQNFGITFNTEDAAGNAAVTIDIEDVPADKRVSYVAETYYKAFDKLAQLERNIEAAVAEYDTHVREVTESITVM